ncbi:unnamed protein product [Moneuplotes crassus]|uniref:RNA helicase n=1 Tax=Euplotes crassus TaxID=5936 RepID=A0AAD1XCU7_EUPCR|nr:unnamed protein product [Moneuplotes crassus]
MTATINDENLVLDYEELEQNENLEGAEESKDKSYHLYGNRDNKNFSDLNLKKELLDSISKVGFETPGEVQAQCIPEALLGVDILCQAKSGMGKTAVFILATLQLLDKDSKPHSVLVVAPTRELAIQIKKEFERLGSGLSFKSMVFVGGEHFKKDLKALNKVKPHIIIGTPGKLKDLILHKDGINGKNVTHFVIDECDLILKDLDVRAQVQRIFISTQTQKQTMMFTATLPPDVLKVARFFLDKQKEIIINDKYLVLDGLKLLYQELKEEQKIRRTVEVLEEYKYNQAIVFAKSCRRADALSKVLQGNKIKTVCMHAKKSKTARDKIFKSVKKGAKKVIICTDVLGRGIDLEKIDFVLNFDMPKSSDAYLHRVGRAGRFGTKGLSISFISSEEDKKLLEEIQSRFTGKVEQIPTDFDPSPFLAEAKPKEGE